MINPNELRIGNWLKRHDGLEVQLSNIGRKGTNIGPDDFPVYLDWEMFEPIPLTFEILKSIGFNIVGSLDNKGVVYKMNQEGLWEFNEIEIKYLHQLQNIYHSLTGEELQYVPQ